MADYDLILVATDLSDPSLAAVRAAADLAERLGSRIVLTYVMEPRLPPMVASFAGQPEDEILERHRQHAEQELAACAKRDLPGREVELVVRKGAPHQEIVRLAIERSASMIIVGTHGHGFLTHALAGSTAERVLHHAPCPVLVVRSVAYVPVDP
jgi:universal stress protein A